MKILKVNCFYPPYEKGGGTVVFYNLCSEINKYHNVFVFSGRDDKETRIYDIKDYSWEGIPVRSVNIKNYIEDNQKENYLNHKIEKPFEEYLDSIDPELVHFHSIQGLGASLIKKVKHRNIPVIVTMHDWWWFCQRQFLVDINFNVCPDVINPEICHCSKWADFQVLRIKYLKEIVNDIDLILVPSQFLKLSLERNGVPGGKIMVNGNGVMRPNKISERKNIKKIRFSYVGGLNKYKGIHILEAAINRIHRNEDYVLKIYGVGLPEKSLKSITEIKRLLLRNIIRPGRLFWQIKSMIAMKRRNKNIVFLPLFKQEQLDDVFSETDVLIVPSVMRESFSLVTREALIRNVPVICSDSGGPEEIIQDGINGMVFKTNDPDDLAKKIDLILRKPQLIDEFRRNIDCSGIRIFNQQTEELLNIYSDLMNTSHQKGVA